MKVYSIALVTIFSIAAAVKKSTAFTPAVPSTIHGLSYNNNNNNNNNNQHGVPTTATSLSTTSVSLSTSSSSSGVSSSSSSTSSSFSMLFPQSRRKSLQLQHLTATALSPMDDSSSSSSSSFSKGLFTFKTKYGYLNPFAIYYGVTSILLGLPWFVVLTLCQIMYKITNNAWDKMRRFPIFFSHVWGVLLLRLTRSYPTVEGMEILDKFYKE
jgi:hypothetical protein